MDRTGRAIADAAPRVAGPSGASVSLASRIATPTGLRLQRQCACGGQPDHSGECADCRKKRVQRAARSGAGRAQAPGADVGGVLSRPGESLPADLGSGMSQRLGFDLSRVRIHRDEQASRSAAALDAHAYTVGRHVVFGRGEYAPQSRAGLRLLAHELVHVVQQRGAPVGLQTSLEVNEPGGADEREADALAERALAGREGAPLRPGPLRVQRAVKESVVKDFQPGAKVCLVHLHGDEQNALNVAKQMRKGRCANLVYIDSKKRHVHLDDIPWTVGKTSGKASCEADPNRVFTTAGWSAEALKVCNGMPSDAKAKAAVEAQAKLELRSFGASTLKPAIDACRNAPPPEILPKSQVSDLLHPLPTVAFHNNEPIEERKPKDQARDLTIKQYEKGTEKGATERDATRLKGATNPHIETGEDIDNFILTTQEPDFAALSQRRNVVLQSTSPTDDGSLSVAMKDERYINIEAQGKPFSGTGKTRFITNWNMANEVMTHLGIPPTCDAPPSAPSKEACEQVKADGIDIDCSQYKSESDKDQGPLGKDLLNDALPRETARTDKCLVFPDQATLDAHKQWWRSEIDAMAAGTAGVTPVVEWILGVRKPGAAVLDEVKRQKGCMLDALKAAAKKKGSGIAVPSTIWESHYRDYVDQEDIWTKKFDFTRTTKFDKVSAAAAAKCPGLVTAGDKWEPSGNADHEECWLKKLNADERQQEILQASSAPGVSRHHWGTDLDILSDDPKKWEKGQTGTTGFWDEYTWLMRNASSYGFIQSFLATTGGYGKGYMEERWHYSYYPIAQALLEFVKAHETDVDTALKARWGTASKYTFIVKEWKSFMNSVNQRGQF